MDKNRSVLCAKVVVSLTILIIIIFITKPTTISFTDYYDQTSLIYIIEEEKGKVIHWDPETDENQNYIYNINNKEFVFKDRQAELENENKTVDLIKTTAILSLYNKEYDPMSDDNEFYSLVQSSSKRNEYKKYFSYEIPVIKHKEVALRKESDKVLNTIKEEYDNYLRNIEFSSEVETLKFGIRCISCILALIYLKTAIDGFLENVGKGLHRNSRKI